MSDNVKVEFDQSLHPSVKFEELDESAKLAFAGMDTAYNLLRVTAVRVTLQSIRDEAAEQGQTLPSDEELFKAAKESGIEGAPTSYMDLAPAVTQAAMALHEAFEYLVVVAAEEAVEGMFGGEDPLDG